MEFESFEVSFSPTYIHEFQEHGLEARTDSSVNSWVVDYEQEYELEARMGSSDSWMADCRQEYGLKVYTGSSVNLWVTECGQEYELEACTDNSVGSWVTDCRQEYGLEEATFSVLQKDDYHSNSNDVDIQECLQLETDIMDLDFIDEDAVFSQNREQETAVLTPTGEAGACGFLTPENCSSHLRTIQEELMEETSVADLLLMGAEAVQAGNRDLASMIVLKLNNLQVSGEEEEETGHLDRLALYFTQGLVLKTMNYGEQKWQEGSMSAFQMLQEISPYIKFAHFTANQAILEATQDRREVHIIDFDIMEGIQWPPLMAELADRENASLRITAMVAESQSWAHTQQTGKRLHEFANSISLSFAFDQILLTKEQDLEQIQSLGNNPIANLMIHQLHMPHRESPLIKIFLNGLRKLSPQMIIMVEEELFNISRTPSMSFVEFFREAIHHYTSLSDSLQGGFCGGYKLAQRVIEKEFLGPRIMDSVRQFPSGKRERQTWGQGVYSLKGFKPIPMSSCNVSQAKYLVSLFNGGYWVQHEQCRLALCWKSRPLTTASIWVPTTSSISHSLSRSTSFD